MHKEDENDANHMRFLHGADTNKSDTSSSVASSVRLEDRMPPQSVARAAHVARCARDNALEVVLKVTSIKHARSEEVLAFCLKELKEGTTYNQLRVKLGCKPAAVDQRWRAIRSTLAEMVMPSSDDEAIMASHALSGFMIKKIEDFGIKVQKRALEQRGEENEHHFYKLQLDAMKMIAEKLDKQMEHYIKMKAVQKAEKSTQGTTIVFNNLYHVPRPGDVTPLQDAAKLITQLEKIEEDVDS
jgi:hypothetical protein